LLSGGDVACALLSGGDVACALLSGGDVARATVIGTVLFGAALVGSHRPCRRRLDVGLLQHRFLGSTGRLIAGLPRTTSDVSGPSVVGALAPQPVDRQFVGRPGRDVVVTRPGRAVARLGDLIAGSV